MGKWWKESTLQGPINDKKRFILNWEADDKLHFAEEVKSDSQKENKHIFIFNIFFHVSMLIPPSPPLKSLSIHYSPHLQAQNAFDRNL